MHFLISGLIISSDRLDLSN